MRKRRWYRLPEDYRREVVRRSREGATYDEIMGELGLPNGVVQRVLQPLGGVLRAEQWNPPSGFRLSLDERVEIQTALARGETLRAIASALERSPSTISREVAKNGGRERYQAVAAHRAACRAARRPKPAKLGCGALVEVVERWLTRLWSPEEIAAMLRLEYPDRPEMWVSHETIYKSLYVQGRGELRRELHHCLRTGRASRQHHGRVATGARIANMVMISERPAEAADRAVPGHWEGDLLIGANGKSAIGTLVERSSRFVLLLHLPNGRSAEAVRDAMTAKIATLPQALVRSITWDQGSEMAQHQQFSVDTAIPVFFCDPHSPWQRGSNENTNGLLRQYFPKGTSLRRYSPAELDIVADSLNNRPRKTLGWQTPMQRLNQLLSAVTG